MSWIQQIAAWMVSLGLSAPSAVLWALLGSLALILLLGVACVALMELGTVHVERRDPARRGATRNPRS